MICCGVLQKPFKTVKLLPDFNHRDRQIQVFICPVCGKLFAELTQYSIRTKKYKREKLKKRRLAKYITKLENDEWIETITQIPTRQNAGFVYGVNKEDKKGNIYQYSVDFNGLKKLVKVVSSQ